MSVTEVRRSGLASLALATELLQRARRADPEAGQWEAADVQWWWRSPRRSDTLDRSFWLDDAGPVAAILLTDWARTWGCDLIRVPGVAGVSLDEMWARAMTRIGDLPPDPVEVLARDDDKELQWLLADSGFVATDEGDRTYWLEARDRPPVAPLPDGFRLVPRSSTPDRPHPMQRRSGGEVATRLERCSLYDPDLDLAVEAPDGDVAGYALFWHDPETLVGLVEPVRVEEEYQRRGLALALVSEGLDRLARRGAGRLKVSCETDAACALYTRAGFRLTGSSTTWRRDSARLAG